MATINPTRMELTRFKKKLVTARRGHKLLKDKRDGLMREFLSMVRENMKIRKRVEAALNSSNQKFMFARSTMSEQEVKAALMASGEEITVEADYANIMSVDIPKFDYKTAAHGYSYGFAFTSGELDEAVESLSDLVDDMIKLSEIEEACRLMSKEIEKTRRRVNALEHVLIPQTEANIKYISMKLDENERSSQTRLMKVKDMMLEEAHHYKERANG
ncbi:MAG: V-type ATP synthase subunit D [Lachnospiraceae bacterium]|nr:V-type ATP synthase subunit D [Lachnospiraceae bacterium]